MEKRTFLAIILSIAILIIWQWLFRPKHLPVSSPTGSPAVTEEKSFGEQAEKDIVPREAVIPSTKSEKTFEIETDKMIYVLSENEASIIHCFLKEDILIGKTTVDLVLNGKLLNNTGSGNWSYIWENQPYRAKFIQTIGDFNIEKTFNFENNSYLIDVEYIIRNTSGYLSNFEGLFLSIGPGLGTDTKELKENKRILRAIAYSVKKVEKLKVGSHKFSEKWAGLDNRYFLSVFFKTNNDFKNIKIEKVEKLPVAEISTGKIELLSNEERIFSVTSYIGPKGFVHLKGIKVNKTDPQLEKAIDFGFFGDLSKLALTVLNYIYKTTGNYGWAIVIISIFLNIIFFPLSRKSFKSAQAMKLVQGDVKAIQAKYKSDPKKMNTEVWALYKAKGVNPFSGCLPMIVQLPIFWALFTMLRNAYELRGAPWILWIKDLSAADTLFTDLFGLPFTVGFLPLVMGAGMFLQQKMTGSASDPTQRQMMIFMPIIFTVMFMGFPSGLVLYWLTNSLITIAEQWFIFSKGVHLDKKVKA